MAAAKLRKKQRAEEHEERKRSAEAEAAGLSSAVFKLPKDAVKTVAEEVGEGETIFARAEKEKQAVNEVLDDWFALAADQKQKRVEGLMDKITEQIAEEEERNGAAAASEEDGEEGETVMVRRPKLSYNRHAIREELWVGQEDRQKSDRKAARRRLKDLQKSKRGKFGNEDDGGAEGDEKQDSLETELLVAGKMHTVHHGGNASAVGDILRVEGAALQDWITKMKSREQELQALVAEQEASPALDGQENPRYAEEVHDARQPDVRFPLSGARPGSAWQNSRKKIAAVQKHVEQNRKLLAVWQRTTPEGQEDARGDADESAGFKTLLLKDRQARARMMAAHFRECKLFDLEAACLEEVGLGSETSSAKREAHRAARREARKSAAEGKSASHTALKTLGLSKDADQAALAEVMASVNDMNGNRPRPSRATMRAAERALPRAARRRLALGLPLPTSRRAEVGAGKKAGAAAKEQLMGSDTEEEFEELRKDAALRTGEAKVAVESSVAGHTAARAVEIAKRGRRAALLGQGQDWSSWNWGQSDLGFTFKPSVMLENCGVSAGMQNSDGLHRTTGQRGGRHQRNKQAATNRQAGRQLSGCPLFLNEDENLGFLVDSEAEETERRLEAGPDVDDAAFSAPSLKCQRTRERFLHDPVFAASFRARVGREHVPKTAEERDAELLAASEKCAAGDTEAQELLLRRCPEKEDIQQRGAGSAVALFSRKTLAQKKAALQRLQRDDRKKQQAAAAAASRESGDNGDALKALLEGDASLVEKGGSQELDDLFAKLTVEDIEHVDSEENWAGILGGLGMGIGGPAEKTTRAQTCFFRAKPLL